MNTQQWRKIFSYTQWLHRHGKVLLVMFAMIALVLGAKRVLEYPHFALHEVTIAGAHHINRVELQQHLLPLMTGNNYFTVDLQQLKEVVAESPWVQQVIIQRVFPEQLLIHLKERQPVARWNMRDLLADNGDIFQPGIHEIPNALPALVGDQGEQQNIWQAYKEATATLMPLHLSITRFARQINGVSQLTLNNGMEVIANSQDLLTRLQHFVKVYPKIVADQPGSIQYVDLRYTNGMAIRRTQVLPRKAGTPSI